MINGSPTNLDTGQDAYTYGTTAATRGLKVGDNVQLALGGAITGSYSYDAATGKLSQATIGGVTQSYGFDSAGNLGTITQGATTTSLVYDGANRLTEKDVNGSPTTVYKWDSSNYGWRISQGPTQLSQPITYGYTSTGRLSSYGDAARSPQVSATYAYDGQGQRRQSVTTIGAQATTTTYTYEGLTLLSLYASQSGGSNPTNWEIDFLYGEDGAAYGGLYRCPAASTTPTFFGIVTTDRGDVAELIDANGDPFAAYRYDVWGNPIGGANDQWGNPTGITTQSTSLVTGSLPSEIANRQILRYAGYAYDAESYLYYCSARSYDPATRQWTSGDPAKADGEESVYQYCAGEPVGNSDPSGEKRLNVKRVVQARPSWCWAACGVSVIKWYFPNSKVTQKKFCKFVKGNTQDQSATEPEVVDGLWHWNVGGIIKWMSMRMYTWADIKSLIDMGDPLIAGTDTPAHMWVLCGYAKNAKGQGQIWLMNPTTGKYVKKKLSKFEKDYSLESLILTSKQVH